MSEFSDEGAPTVPADPRDSDPLVTLFQQTFTDDHNLDGAAMDARILGDLFELDAKPKIGRFEIHERLGGGSMGEVYSAWDPQLQRRIAIKLTYRRPNVSTEDILREARTLASVEGSHVIPVYDVGVHDGRGYLAMKNIEGQTLAQWQQLRRSLPEIVAVYAQAAQGLAEMHRAGVIHCDFKPDNVLIDHEDRVWVSDFGLAQHDENGSERGHVGGTLGYIAPEQLFDGVGSPASDQFSFCVALFKAIYGTLPFPGKGRALGQRLARCEIVFPARARKVPGWLVRLLRRGLHREPSQRYPGMEALLADLVRDRGKPARIGTMMGTMVAVVAAVILLWAPPEAPVSDPLASTWDPERREEVRQHFDAFELPWIVIGGGEIIDELDHWAFRWNREWEFIAFAGKMIEDGAAVADCLADQRSQVQRFVNDLGQAGAQWLGNAPELASNLPDPAFCFTTTNGHPPTLTPEVAQTQQAELVVARGLRLNGNHEGSRALLDKLLVLARAEAWTTLEIDVLRERGLAWSDAGRRDLALTDVQVAIRLAIEHREFGRIAELSIDRVWVADATVPRELRREWLEQAEAYQSHLHVPSLANRLVVERALDAYEGGEPQIAEKLMREHLDELEQLGSLGTFHEIDCLHTLALAVDAQGPSRASEAENMFLEAMRRAELVYGADHPQTAKLLTDAGYHALDQGNLGLARTRLMAAMELRREILPADHPIMSRAYSAIAGLELRSGNLELAKAAADDALRSNPERDRVYEIYEILGHVAVGQEQWRDAIKWFHWALAACPEDLEGESPDVQIALAVALAGSGDHRAATERFDRYLPAFEESFDLPAQGDSLCSTWITRIAALDNEDLAEQEARRVRALLPDTTQCELSR